jgi:cell division transport system permease protein
MPLEFLMFWTRETFSNIVRNRLMSLLAISTVTVGLFIMGAFYLALSNFHAVVRSETEQLDMAVMLKRDITPQRRKELLAAVKIPQVKAVQAVSQSQVLKEFVKDDPNIPIKDFEDANYNPFHEELRIKLKDPANDYIKVRDYFATLKGKGVVDVRSPAETDAVKALLKFNRFLAVSGLVALWMLGLAILLIIHNAIRLTIFARRREILIMEQVGATQWFIRVPFLLEGIFYGAIGAVIASIVLSPLYAASTRLLGSWLPALLPAVQTTSMAQCIGLMFLAGLIFGMLGSWFSLARTWGQTSHI